MILKFILFLFIIFLIILLLGVGFLSRFVRSFTKRSAGNSNNKRYSSGQQEHGNNSSHTSTGHKKIFAKDEGEYIDYEEVK
jgi:hypothetical protein